MLYNFIGMFCLSPCRYNNEKEKKKKRKDNKEAMYSKNR